MLSMKTLCVLQHIEAEYLGLLEDHFEGRNIRFRYCRLRPGASIPATAEDDGGFVLLGAGPKAWSAAISYRSRPGTAADPGLSGARTAGDRHRRWGLHPDHGIRWRRRRGAASLRRRGRPAHRPGALNGHLPETFPISVYMRDRPVLPSHGRVLAAGADGEPMLFQLRDNCLGFVCHPGIKSAMIEDLIMEFDEVPEDTPETLAALRLAQVEIAAALAPIMVGLVEITDLMEPASLAALHAASARTCNFFYSRL